MTPDGTLEEEGARAALARLIDERGEDYAGLSRLIRRNSAYIQQYIKRGTPRRLAERDRRLLARYFGVEESVLGGLAAGPGRGLAPVARLDVDASAGAGAFDGDESREGHIAFDPVWLRRIARGAPDQLSIIRVAGDSMAPTLADAGGQPGGAHRLDPLRQSGLSRLARLRSGRCGCRWESGLDRAADRLRKKRWPVSVARLAPPVEQPDQGEQKEADPRAGEETDAGLADEHPDQRAREERQSEQGAAGARGFAIGCHRRPMAAADGRFQPYSMKLAGALRPVADYNPYPRGKARYRADQRPAHQPAAERTGAGRQPDQQGRVRRRLDLHLVAHWLILPWRSIAAPASGSQRGLVYRPLTMAVTLLERCGC